MTNNGTKQKEINFAAIPRYLRRRKQWVLWKYEKTKTGKLTKVPYQPNGHYKASTTKPGTWNRFKYCKMAYEIGSFNGIGFCFARNDGLAGIDLDHCYDNDGQLKPWAQEIVERFKNTYIEKSPSGMGLHIWCLGSKSGVRTAMKWENTNTKTDDGVEVYDSTKNRYLTVTGDAINV